MFQFGGFQLDPGEHLLLHEGRPVSLTPKTFDLLVFLVEHHGRLVSKDQLLEAIWPESFVEEANLTVSISALRRALGERRGENQYIDTVPKKGYRFSADVARIQKPTGPATATTQPSFDESATAAQHGPPETRLSAVHLAPGAAVAEVENRPEAEISRREQHLSHKLRLLWMLVPAIALAAITVTAIGYLHWRTSNSGPGAPRRLAVLPFQNLNRDPASDFLGFSLADAIITRLGYVSELTVRPSYAVQKYRTEIPDIQQLARALSVDTLVTGSFIREGEDLRVTYQLVEAKSDRIVGHGAIDLKYRNVLAVQDDVSAEVIRALRLTPSPSEASRLRNEQPIPPLAYEYYLRGVDLYARSDFLMAINMLEKSAEIYPNYALTWAHLGRAYTARASFQFGGAELYRKAQAAYEKAIGLEPSLPFSRIYMANLLTDTGKPEQAVPLLRGTLQSNPNLAEAHWELGYAYRHAGMLEQSIRECRRARELDPSVKLTTSTINGYLYLGDYDSFLRSLPPVNESAFLEFYRGFALYHLHQWDQSAETLDHAYELDPSMLQTQVGKALSYHLRHKNPQGIALLKEAEDKIIERGVGDAEASYKIAQAYAELGDTTSALRTFRHSVETGFFPYPYFVRDPLITKIRLEKQFDAELETARLRSQAFQRLFF